MNIQIIDLHDPLWQQTLQHLHHDVYHLPEYVNIESKRTQTIPHAFLLVDCDKILFVPYLLRKCENILTQESNGKDWFDIVSPYGYSGILLSDAAICTPGFPDFALQEFK